MIPLTPLACALAKASVRSIHPKVWTNTYSLLGAPVGSMLVGPSHIISLARRYRKLFGGAMRQIGILSAAAAYALSHHLPLLPSVHQKAKRLAMGLEGLGVRITIPVETCMVFFDASPIGLTGDEIAAKGETLEVPLKMFGGDRLVVSVSVFLGFKDYS